MCVCAVCERETEQELTISTPVVKGKNIYIKNRIIKWMTPRETSELAKTNRKEGRNMYPSLESSDWHNSLVKK